MTIMQLPQYIFLTIIAIFGGLSLVSCSDSGSASTQRGVLQSVEDWKYKAGYNSDYGPSSINGDKDSMFNRVGRPFREEKHGDYYYLYWKCSDGTVKLKVYGPQYSWGEILGAGRLTVSGGTATHIAFDAPREASPEQKNLAKGLNASLLYQYRQSLEAESNAKREQERSEDLMSGQLEDKIEDKINSLDQARAERRAEANERRVERMAEELGLSPQQTDQFATIVGDAATERAEYLSEIRENGWENIDRDEMRSTMETIREDEYSALEGVLTPEQLTQYQESNSNGGGGRGGN